MQKEIYSRRPSEIPYINRNVILTKFFESAPVLMGVVEIEDNNIRHILDNSESAHFFGTTPESMSGSLSSDLGIDEKNLKFWIEQYRKAEFEEQPVKFEYIHRDTILSVRVNFLEKSEAGLSRYSYVAQDITDMRKAQKDESFEEIANKLPQIIWLARPDGTVYWYNEWFYKFTGIRKEEGNEDLIKISPIHPEDREQLEAKLAHSLNIGESTYIYFRVRRHDGEYRWHLSRGIALRDETRTIVKWIGSNTDIHENRVLFEQLRNEQDAREKFVAALSHDLRTPLTAAKMSAQIISRKASDVDLVTKSAARIVENMNRADIMIRDLLDASRIKAGQKISLEFGDCNLRTLISEALDDLRTLHGDRFVLKDGVEIEGYWSCAGIRRILENLCNNAIKYGSDHDPVTIFVTDEGDHVNITVHNEGDPIPRDLQKKLFELYSRAENAEASKQRGWGLGLTLVKGIAEAHRGHVTVTSSENEGTSFTISLPKYIDQ